MKGRDVIYISQPYGLTWSSLKAIVAYCEQHGLEAQIDASLSWHFPGSTLLVEYRKVPIPASREGAAA